MEMTQLAALMLFYCSGSITVIAKIHNFGPENYTDIKKSVFNFYFTFL